MPAFQEPRGSTIEYRFSGVSKGINVALGFLLILGGIGLGYLFTTPSFRFLQGEVLAVGAIGVGVYYLIFTMRARVVIQSSRITIVNAFAERTADVADIEGVRSIRSRYGTVTGKLFNLRDGNTFTISLLSFDLDQRFWDWLGQVPNLDKGT